MRRDLDAVLRGRTIVERRGQSRTARCGARRRIAAFVDAVHGATRHAARAVSASSCVVRSRRRRRTDVVVIHLGMSGQLRVASSTRRAATAAHARRVDARRRTRGALRRPADVRPDVRAAPVHDGGASRRARAPRARRAAEFPTPTTLAPLLAGRRVAVKTRLMDQTGRRRDSATSTPTRSCSGPACAGAAPSGSITDAEIARIHAATARCSPTRWRRGVVARRRAVRRPLRSDRPVPARPRRARAGRRSRARCAATAVARPAHRRPLRVLVPAVPVVTVRRVPGGGVGAGAGRVVPRVVPPGGRGAGPGGLGAQPPRRQGGSRVRGRARRGGGAGHWCATGPPGPGSCGSR